ncbi:50S ribosomal protein L11 methyltransferase [Desulfobulbus alkaliphilus]|uniref:50S ribosomal protein L11 methyltransferase n=1 Tax=Desulfobulbus alkaliphilus TaxID=869814 RepID=UPI0019638AAA|nr:50S ribosomal protein L11 methyltransferase [Desulfobulbus alkaliphilus]MBM9537709.1 50S ribosomal protein L11 methyltransferase [Desulfobulbus alkaliphilus]
MEPLNDDDPAGGRWLKVTFFCPSPLLEPASDLMGVLSGSGVEISPEEAGGAFLSGFFRLGESHDPRAQRDVAEQTLAACVDEMTRLFALYNCSLDEPMTTLLADQDWASSWQQYFKPFEMIPGLVIKPSWEVYQPAPGEHVLEMDPGMAFGTGQHASTRMASALIRQSLRECAVDLVLDVGTGTAILAMTAARFGAGRILATDNDPDATTVARANILRNALDDQIEVVDTPLAAIAGAYQLVCANIVHDVLVEMAPELTRLTAIGGRLVLAGLLAGDQEQHVIAVYHALGCTLVNQLYEEEWVALLLAKA